MQHSGRTNYKIKTLLSLLLLMIIFLILLIDKLTIPNEFQIYTHGNRSFLLKSYVNTSCSNKLPSGKYCEHIYRLKNTDYKMIKEFWHSDTIYIGKRKENIYAVNSYYDDRPALKGHTMIHSVVITTDKDVQWLKTAKCYLWLNCSTNPLVVSSTFTNLNRIIPKVHNVRYLSYLFSCKVPRDNPSGITHISLSVNNCKEPYLYVPVVYPDKPDTFEHTFGMCEANGVSFGHYNDSFAPWLIEWFEANMMFGITEFNIYNATLTVSPNVQKVLDYYQEKGHLIFHQHPTPLEKYDQFHRPSADIAMRTALNDCLYRNMYRYKYVVGIDLDEIIVPQQHENYYDMLKGMDDNKSYTGTYTFQAEGFFQSFVEKDDAKVDSPYPLKTSQYIYSVKDHRVKSFTNPRHCMGMYSHNCLKYINGTQTLKEIVNDNVGLVHHYRNKCMKQDYLPSNSLCKQKFTEKKKQERMLLFQDVLLNHISNVAQELNIKLMP